jgi:hypothetical protein
MNIPLEYRNSVDQIVELTTCTEYLYGSRRHIWLAFRLSEYKLNLDRRIQYGARNFITYEIEHPQFLIFYEQKWPSNRKYWTWNGQQCDPNKYQRDDTNFEYIYHTPGGEVTAEYVGDLDEIASTAMFMWMTLASSV